MDSSGFSALAARVFTRASVSVNGDTVIATYRATLRSPVWETVQRESPTGFSALGALEKLVENADEVFIRTSWEDVSVISALSFGFRFAGAGFQSGNSVSVQPPKKAPVKIPTHIEPKEDYDDGFRMLLSSQAALAKDPDNEEVARMEAGRLFDYLKEKAPKYTELNFEGFQKWKRMKELVYGLFPDDFIEISESDELCPAASAGFYFEQEIKGSNTIVYSGAKKDRFLELLRVSDAIEVSNFDDEAVPEFEIDFVIENVRQ